MTEPPLKYGSLMPYHFLLAVGVLIGSYTSMIIADYSLITLYESISNWIVNSVLVLLTLGLFSFLVSWRMKQQVTLMNPEWNFKEQEITFREFDSLVKEYRKKYSHIIVQIDFVGLVLSLLICLAAIILPILLAQSITTFVWASPAFGLCILLFGLFSSSLFLQVVSLIYCSSLQEDW